MKIKEKSKVAFRPTLSDDNGDTYNRQLIPLIQDLRDLPKSDAISELRRSGRQTTALEKTPLRACFLLLADLLEHGWSIEAEDSDIWLTWDNPRSRYGRSSEVKAELRTVLLAAGTGSYKREASEIS
jgi:hypothetical protein